MYIQGEEAVPAAVERIVVQATRKEKKAIVAKAKKLGLAISELMRRGANAYQPEEADEELGTLADAARAAAERAGRAIDNALTRIEESNQRIRSMEAAARLRQAMKPSGTAAKPRRRTHR